MIYKENYVYIGKTLKTHGYQGDLLVLLENFKREEFEKEEHLFLNIDGINVPFFIESTEFLDENRAIIKLEDLDNDIDASEFAGLKVFLADRNSKKKKESFEIHDVIGFIVEDINSQIRGRIEEIIEIPANPLLKIVTESNKELLVPYNKDLIEKINIKKSLLIMKIPEGLL